MMKSTVCLTVGLAVLALFVFPSWAEPVPRRATGTWSITKCGGDGLTVLVNSHSALMIESAGANTVVAVAAAEWVGTSFVLTLKNSREEVVLPPLGSLKQCDSPPSALALLFAESIAVFMKLDEINAHCLGEDDITRRCVAAAFEIIDITDDGEFSRAELSRAVRVASFFIGHHLISEGRQEAFVPLEELYTAWLAASAFGPFVATNLIDSYDFDGDGFLSSKELLQDRTPEEGLQGVVASLATKAPPAIIKSMIGMFELLQLVL